MPARKQAPSIGSPRVLAALTSAQHDARARALEALSRMRTQRLSLSAAARESGTTRATVRRYAGAALTRNGARYAATPADRLYRRMVVLTPEGRREVDVRSSRKASQVGAHWNAVDRYLRTGDGNALRRFGGKSVGGYEFASTTDQAEQFARTGELAIQDIYPHR